MIFDSEELKIKKSAIRKQMKTLKIENKDFQSQVIVKEIEEFLKVNQYRKLGMYLPLPDEVNIRELFESEWIVDNCEIYLPRWIENQKPVEEMSFYLYEDEKNLESIEVFNQSMPQIKKTKIGIPDFILVPGMAFTKEGFRLGRGKGYYDKYLAGKSCFRAGICFAEQMIKELPLGKFDQKLDQVFYARESS